MPVELPNGNGALSRERFPHDSNVLVPQRLCKLTRKWRMGCGCDLETNGALDLRQDPMPW